MPLSEPRGRRHHALALGRADRRPVVLPRRRRSRRGVRACRGRRNSLAINAAGAADRHARAFVEDHREGPSITASIVVLHGQHRRLDLDQHFAELRALRVSTVSISRVRPIGHVLCSAQFTYCYRGRSQPPPYTTRPTAHRGTVWLQDLRAAAVPASRTQGNARRTAGNSQRASSSPVRPSTMPMETTAAPLPHQP